MDIWDPKKLKFQHKIEAIENVKEWEQSTNTNTAIIIGPDSLALEDMMSYSLANGHIEQPERISTIIHKLHQNLWLKNKYKWKVPEYRQLINDEILLVHSRQFLQDFFGNGKRLRPEKQ